MSELYLEKREGPWSKYNDKTLELSEEDYLELLKNTCTVYIGFLSFFTREYQLLEYFSQVGVIKKLTMGLHKHKMLPCGFAFMEFTSHKDAGRAVTYLNWSKIDGRIIKVDWDIGVSEERKFGRGDLGGQKRDDWDKEGNKREDTRPQRAPREPQKCKKCDDEEHWTRDCPDLGDACYKCGQDGHMAKDCEEGGGGGNACFKCGQEGHFSRECPEAGGSGSGCFKCGEEGHFAKECPNPGGGGGGGKGGQSQKLDKPAGGFTEEVADGEWGMPDEAPQEDKQDGGGW
jgi:hypothetical protein